MFCEIPDSLKTLKYLHIKMYIVYIYETESYIKMIFAITIPDICTENYRTLINNLIWFLHILGEVCRAGNSLREVKWLVQSPNIK